MSNIDKIKRLRLRLIRHCLDLFDSNLESINIWIDLPNFVLGYKSPFALFCEDKESEQKIINYILQITNGIIV